MTIKKHHITMNQKNLYAACISQRMRRDFLTA